MTRWSNTAVAQSSAGGAVPNYSERNDIWTSASLLVEWRAIEWLSFFASGEYTADITDFAYQVTNDATGEVTQTGAGVQKFVVFGGARVHY